MFNPIILLNPRPPNRDVLSETEVDESEDVYIDYDDDSGFEWYDEDDYDTDYDGYEYGYDDED